MSRKTGRRWRRHFDNLQRLKTIKIWLKYDKSPSEVERAIHASRYMRNNKTSCSCIMCGNPRKWYKEKTIQEIVFDSQYREYLKFNN